MTKLYNTIIQTQNRPVDRAEVHPIKEDMLNLSSRIQDHSLRK